MAIANVVQREQAVMQLQPAQEEETVSRLAAGVAHEIINYLAVIDGHAGLLLAEPEDSPVGRDRVTEIVRAVERSMSLSRQLLTLGRQNQVIAGMEDALGYLVGDNIKLAIELTPNTDLVWADPGQVEQILLNLVTNARDAIPGTGTITIQTANVESHRGNGTLGVPASYVMLSVSDTGIGMNQQTLAHLFEAFCTTKQDGTGLGLWSVHRIVTESNGHIRVQSAPGRGATFEILLPSIGTDETQERHSDD